MNGLNQCKDSQSGWKKWVWTSQICVKWLNQSLYTLNIGVKRKGPGAKIFTTRDLKVGGVVVVMLDEFQSQPCLTINILIMRDWEG